MLQGFLRDLTEVSVEVRKMLNHRILLGILVFISTNVLADECTKYVEAYASGFEMIAGMDGGDSNKAEIELDRIRSFQNKMPDCKVVQQIPALATAQKAIKAAKNETE